MKPYYLDEKGKKRYDLDLYSLGATPKGQFVVPISKDVGIPDIEALATCTFKYNRFFIEDILMRKFDNAFKDIGVNEQFFYWIANTCSFAFGYEPQKLFLDTSEKESFLKNNEDISKKDFRDVLLAIHLLANYKTFPNKTVAYYFTAYQDFDPDFKFAKSDINTERNRDISGAFGTKINRISKDIYQPLGQKQYGGTLMSKGIKIFERFLTETNQLKLQKKGDKYTGAFPYVNPEHQWTWTNEKK